MRYLVLFVALPLSLAAHPRLLLDSSDIANLKAKAASGNEDWRALQRYCDSYLPKVVRYPDWNGEGTSGTVPGSGSSTVSPLVIPGYQGETFLEFVWAYGACYLAVKDNPNFPASLAAGYGAKLRYILHAASRPPATMRKQGEETPYWVNPRSKGGGAPIEFDIRTHKLRAGDLVKVQGALGCAAANGDWKVLKASATVITVGSIDSGETLVSNAACTNYSHNILRDNGYGVRNYTVGLALGYDWGYDALSAQDREEIIAEINRELREYVRGSGSDQFTFRSMLGHPSHNYFAGYFEALVFAHIATAGENPAGAQWLESELNTRFAGDHYLLEFFNRWLPQGGYPQGLIHYGHNAIRNLLLASLAMKVSGTDWTREPYNWQWPEATLRYYMQFVTPPKTELDDNNYVARVAAPEAGRINLNTVAVMTHWARKFGSQYAGKIQDYYNVVNSSIRRAAELGVKPPYAGPRPWFGFLFYDPSAPTEDFTELPRTYYGFESTYAVSRSDWGEDATYLTFDATIEFDNVDQGKTHRNSGSVTVQRGRKHLVVYGLGEAARSSKSSAEYSAIHSEGASRNNRKDAIFWADRPGGESGAQSSLSQCADPETATPSRSSEFFPEIRSRITLGEDAETYVYWKGDRLHCNAAKSAVDSRYHQQNWVREVMFLRPRIVLVRDQTTTALPDDDRFINWVFPKTPVLSNESREDMPRYHVRNDLEYRGAVTLVLPPSPAVTLVDHKNYGWLYRLEVRPREMNTEQVNFLAVLETADGPESAESVERLQGTRIDAVQLSRSGVAGFLTEADSAEYSYTEGDSVIHRIAGFTPGAAYTLNWSAGRISIRREEGPGTQITSSPAGVLQFKTTAEGVSAMQAKSTGLPGAAPAGARAQRRIPATPPLRRRR